MKEDTQVVVGDEGGAIEATPENGTWGLTEGANYAPARERETRRHQDKGDECGRLMLHEFRLFLGHFLISDPPDRVKAMDLVRLTLFRARK